MREDRSEIILLSTDTSAKITHLSIRISFVGSIELLRDDALADPRLDPGPSPPRGVIWNEKDIVDEVDGDTKGRGRVIDWRESGEKRKERGCDLTVRF